MYILPCLEIAEQSVVFCILLFIVECCNLGMLKLQEWTLQDWTMTDRTMQDWTLTVWTLADGCVSQN